MSSPIHISATLVLSLLAAAGTACGSGADSTLAHELVEKMNPDQAADSEPTPGQMPIDVGSADDLGTGSAADDDALCEPYGVDVECELVEQLHPSLGADSARIARLSGHLAASGRGSYVSVYGDLVLGTKLVGDASSLTERTVTVRGSLNAYGMSAHAVASGTEYVALRLSTTPEDQGGSSTVEVGTSTYYTRCGAGLVPRLPGGSDLVVSRAVEFIPVSFTRWKLRVPVRNIGAEAAVLGGNQLYLSLQKHSTYTDRDFYPWEYAADPLTDGSGNVVDTIEPGQTALAELTISDNDFFRCKPVQVRVDSREQVQSSALDPFGNDTITVATPCLTWTTPITAASLGSQQLYDSIPEDIRLNLQGKTIEDIVSSRVVARAADHKLCSYCHNSATSTSFKYRPTVGPDLSERIYSIDVVAGRTWSDLPVDGRLQGWGLEFVQRPPTGYGAKPAYLRKIMERWLRDGMLTAPYSSGPLMFY